MALIFPDTSPRGDGVSDDEAYDLGQGAGFYVNATQDPWAPHFQMWDYISAELPSVITENFNIDMSRQSITGHSMGGMGALTLFLSPWGITLRSLHLRQFVIQHSPIGGESSWMPIWGRMKQHGQNTMRPA